MDKSEQLLRFNEKPYGDHTGKLRLLKVPSYIAKYWRSEAAGSVVAVMEKSPASGNERLMIPLIDTGQTNDDDCSTGNMNRDSNSATQGERFEYLEIKADNAESKVRYLMSRNTIEADYASCPSIDEPPISEEMIIVGKVDGSASVIRPYNGLYRNLWKSRFIQMQVRDHQTAMDPMTDSNRHIPRTSQNSECLFRYYTESTADRDGSGNSSGGLPKSMRAKRARIDTTLTDDELQRIIFQIMEDSSTDGVSLTELLRKTGQPQGAVRQAVEKICDFKKHKYSLKSQFSRNS